MVAFMGAIMIIVGAVNLKSDIKTKRPSLIGLAIVLILVGAWCIYAFIQNA